jgi:hypothetical protein
MTARRHGSLLLCREKLRVRAMKTCRRFSMRLRSTYENEGLSSAEYGMRSRLSSNAMTAWLLRGNDSG